MTHTILLVEDDRWLAQMYQNALQAGGWCKVLHAETADDALELLDANPTIELLVLDMFLPEHNGVELLHEIASYSDLNTLPVLILTSVSKHDFAMSEERWRHYGVVHYLYKPTTKPVDLVAEVKKQLVKQGASA